MRAPHRCYLIIAHLMQAGATTADDAAYEMGMTTRQMREHLKHLHALKLVHVCEWDRAHQVPVPVYRWGNGRDRVRPKPRTGAEKTRRYRLKKSSRTLTHGLAGDSRGVNMPAGMA